MTEIRERKDRIEKDRNIRRICFFEIKKSRILKELIERKGIKGKSGQNYDNIL